MEAVKGAKKLTQRHTFGGAASCRALEWKRKNFPQGVFDRIYRMDRIFGGCGFQPRVHGGGPRLVAAENSREVRKVREGLNIENH